MSQDGPDPARPPESAAMARLGALLLIAMGALIALLCGACTVFLGFTVVTAPNSGQQGLLWLLLVPLIIGGAPTVGGLVMMRSGYQMYRKAMNPAPDAVAAHFGEPDPRLPPTPRRGDPAVMRRNALFLIAGGVLAALIGVGLAGSMAAMEMGRGAAALPFVATNIITYGGSPIVLGLAAIIGGMRLWRRAGPMKPPEDTE